VRERIEWTVVIVYEPKSGRVSIESEDATTYVAGFIAEGLETEIARRMIKAKLVFKSGPIC
jgi:hypothetical protein